LNIVKKYNEKTPALTTNCKKNNISKQMFKKSAANFSQPCPINTIELKQNNNLFY